MQHKGKAWDAAKGYASGKDVCGWCIKYHLVRTARYESSLYGEEGCKVFAMAWIAKMQYFYTIWKNQDNEDFKFTPADLNDWKEPSDFTALARSWTKKAAVKRVTEFRAIFPRI